jgi:hypothetical protein
MIGFTSISAILLSASAMSSEILEMASAKAATSRAGVLRNPVRSL